MLGRCVASEFDQNTGLALTIALSAMAREDAGEASGVPLFYGIIEICVIPMFALTAWRLGWTYAPTTDNVCLVMAGNYQPISTAVPPDEPDAAPSKSSSMW